MHTIFPWCFGKRKCIVPKQYPIYKIHPLLKCCIYGTGCFPSSWSICECISKKKYLVRFVSQHWTHPNITSCCIHVFCFLYWIRFLTSPPLWSALVICNLVALLSNSTSSYVLILAMSIRVVLCCSSISQILDRFAVILNFHSILLLLLQLSVLWVWFW